MHHVGTNLYVRAAAHRPRMPGDVQAIEVDKRVRPATVGPTGLLFSARTPAHHLALAIRPRNSPRR